jgi:hypothetical protein
MQVRLYVCNSTHESVNDGATRDILVNSSANVALSLFSWSDVDCGPWKIFLTT